LIEKYPCDDKDELRAREGYHQKKFKEDCVNKLIAGRSIEQYYQDNKEKFKAYYEKNKEWINKKYNCKCGSKYTTAHKARHLKTKKHQDYIKKHSGDDSDDDSSSENESIDC